MKKILFLIFAVMFALFLSGCASNSQKSASSSNGANTVKPVERSGVIMGTDVNVRKGPGTNFDVIGTYKEGEKVQFLQVEKNGWVEVKRENGKNGWVNIYYYVDYVYGDDKYLPKQIVFEADGQTKIGREICPKSDVVVRNYWDKNAPETGKIKAEERVEVLECKRVIKPKGTTTYQGKKIYVLSPEMNTDFWYFVDGKVKHIGFNKSGYKNAEDYIPGWTRAFNETRTADDGYTVWIHIRGQAVDGWLGPNDIKKVEWHREPGSGIFLSEPRKK